MVWLFFYYPTLFILSMPYSIHMLTQDCGISVNSSFCFTHKCTWDFFSCFLGCILNCKKKKFPKNEFNEVFYGCILLLWRQRLRWHHLLPLEVFVDLIHWFVKKCYFWETLLPINFREMIMKKVPNFLTVGEPILDCLGFCWTCPVCIKMSSPKIWSLKSEIC